MPGEKELISESINPVLSLHRTCVFVAAVFFPTFCKENRFFFEAKLFAYCGLVVRILRKQQITKNNFITKKIAIKAANMTAGVKLLPCQNRSMKVVSLF